MPATTQSNKPLAAIYARVSSEEQREGQTIDSQVAELERFAAEKGWSVLSVYKDEGWSGAVVARPALDRLRDDASKGLFRVVLVNDVDRLARDVSHLGVLKRDLEKQDVEVVFRKLPAEKSPTQNLMVNILGSFAEFERELILDRTRRGKRHKVEVRKQYLGSKPPYGFRYIPKDKAAGKEGILQIIPEEADLVRKMFGWVADEGLSARQVVRRLNALGVAPKKGSKRWAKSTVLRILRSEVYAGVWHWNKHRRCEPRSSFPSGRRYPRNAKTSTRLRPRAEWIPLDLPQELKIVERESWEKVQEQLDRNITFSPRNGKHNYLLRGLIRCGGCSAAYVGDPCRGKYYYRCSRRCKTYPTVREEALNDAVWKAVREVVMNPTLVLDQAERFKKVKVEEGSRVLKDHDEIMTAFETLERAEERILDAYRASAISAAQLGGQLEKIETRRRMLRRRKAEAEAMAELNPKDMETSVRDFCRRAGRGIDNFTREKRQRFLRQLLIRVTYRGSQVSIRGRIPVLPTPRSALDAAPKTPALTGGRIATPAIRGEGSNPSLDFRIAKPLPRAGILGVQIKQPEWG